MKWTLFDLSLIDDDRVGDFYIGRLLDDPVNTVIRKDADGLIRLASDADLNEDGEYPEGLDIHLVHGEDLLEVTRAVVATLN